MLNFENKFLVLKREDVDLALEGQQRKQFWNLIDRINVVRNQQGKKSNKYLVVNIDEPYAMEVAKIMDANGHSNATDNVGQDTPFIQFEEEETVTNDEFDDEMRNALQQCMEVDFTELPSFNDGDVVGNPNESQEEFVGRCLKRKMREGEE